MSLADESRSKDPREKLPTAEQAVEIPREEWLKFLNSFSLKHSGWIADIEVIGREGDSRVEVSEEPFAGISPSERGSVHEIVVSFGEDEDVDDPTEHISHAIVNPTRVALIGNGADDLMITSQDGLITVLRFRKEVNPGKPSSLVA